MQKLQIKITKPNTLNEKGLYCNVPPGAHFFWKLGQCNCFSLLLIKFFGFFFLTRRLVNPSSLPLSIIHYPSAYLIILPRKWGLDTFLILHKIIFQAVHILVHALDFRSVFLSPARFCMCLRCCVNGFPCMGEPEKFCSFPGPLNLYCWTQRKPDTEYSPRCMEQTHPYYQTDSSEFPKLRVRWCHLSKG